MTASKKAVLRETHFNSASHRGDLEVLQYKGEIALQALGKAWQMKARCSLQKACDNMVSSQTHTINGAMKWSNGHHLHLQCVDCLLSSSLSQKTSTLGTGQCIRSRYTQFVEQFPPENLQGHVLEVLA